MQFSTWSVLNIEVLGNSVSVWAIALLVATLIFIALKIGRSVFQTRLKKQKLSYHSPLQLFETLVEHTRNLFFIAMAVLVALQFLEIPSRAFKVLQSVCLIFIFIQVWLWGQKAIDFLIAKVIIKDRDLRTEDSLDATAPALRFIGQIILGSLLLLLALDNFGFNVSALITGLGVGGIAIALAVQNILGDLFASLSILFDKPFRVGDFIQINTLQGTVEKIGLKTTRVRSLTGEELVFSNNDLLQSRIQNFRQIKERRVFFTLGLLYETPVEKLKLAEKLIISSIQDAGSTRLDRVHFSGFGDSALLFEVSYYVVSQTAREQFVVQQKVNFGILEKFNAEQIVFAYPTRTLLVKNEAIP